jgi:chromosome partitioning protein
MRSIAIMNQKGGVGKTTTAVNVSAALAATGAKVCLIDLDPQAHATLHFGIEPQVEFDSIYNVLTGEMKLSDVRKQAGENLWIIPAHLDLAAAELELAGVVGREMILRDKLAADDMQFDYIFIDCPPSLGVLTINALTAVDEVFIPLQPHFLALHGLSRLLKTIELVARRLNSRLMLSGVILCMYDGQTRLASEVAQDIDAFFQQKHTQPTVWSNAQMFQTKIRRNIKLAEAPSFGRPIFEYDSNSNGAEDYRCLAGEIALQVR